ncbi:MAG: hypothetical protein K2J70_06765 [Muribaculaceae bacterium]|nr:hypothetical protein [Muribaculaceae bacterium]
MDFSSIVRSFLRENPADRNYQFGASLVLRISGNEYRYRALLNGLPATQTQIIAELESYLRRRDAIPSRERIAEIRKEAQQLISEREAEKDNTKVCTGEQKPVKIFRAGKRADHDSLPDNIKIIFEENMNLKRKMAQYHLEIRNLLRSDKDCAAPDIADLVKLLKQADETYHNNWKAYDGYKG